MKKNKFIEEIKSMGFEVKELYDDIVIKDVKGKVIANASKVEFAVLVTNYRGFYRINDNTKLRLLDLLVEYVKTPIEDKEEEEKYYLKLRGIDGRRFLNVLSDYSEYFIEDKIQVSGDIITQFTQSEIDDMPECYTHPAVWEKIKVESEEDENKGAH